MSNTKSRLLLLFIILLFAFIGGLAFLSLQKKAPSSYSDRMVPSDQPTDVTATLPPGEKVTIKGKVMCLPHKNTSGPISMECAIGLKGVDGKYYAVVDSDPTYAHMSQLPMNENVSIMGTFQPKTDDKYPTIGILTIESVGK